MLTKNFAVFMCLVFRYEVLPCDRKESEGGLSVRDPDYEIVPSGVSDLGPREPDYETLPHRSVPVVPC